jgi:integrase
MFVSCFTDANYVFKYNIIGDIQSMRNYSWIALDSLLITQKLHNMLAGEGRGGYFEVIGKETVTMAKNTDTVHVEGKVRLLKRGRWWHAHYMTPDGYERRSLKVTNLKAAQAEARKVDEQLQGGQYELLKRRREFERETFGQFVNDIFLPQYPRWSEGTHKSTQSLIRQMVEAFGDRPIGAITGDDIETYLARRRGDDEWADSSYNRYLAIFKAIFKYAQERGRIVQSPAAAIKTIRLQKKQPNPYSDTDLKKLLVELGKNLGKWAVAVVAVDTGMRRGELMRLRWNDIDLDQRTILVKDTKNKEDRSIPMTDRVYDVLSLAYSENRASELPTLEVWGVSADIRQLLTRVGKRVGIEMAIMHRLRDTFGTRLADKGVPVDRIKKLMGHKSIEMTLRYVETREHHLRDAIAAISGD